MLELLTKTIETADDGLVLVVHNGPATQVFRKTNRVLVCAYPKRKLTEIRSVESPGRIPMSSLFGLEDVGIGTRILVIEPETETVFEKGRDGWFIAGITAQLEMAVVF